MKLTSKERREVTRLREHGESDFERDHGRPPDAAELRQIHERAQEAVRSVSARERT